MGQDILYPRVLLCALQPRGPDWAPEHVLDLVAHRALAQGHHVAVLGTHRVYSAVCALQRPVWDK